MTARKVTDEATPESVDWSFYENAEIVSHIETAVWKVLGSYGDIGVEREDLLQDALLYVACRPEMVKRYADDLPFIGRTVWRYLNDRREGVVNEALSLRQYDDNAGQQKAHDPEGSRLSRYLEMGDDAEYEAVSFA